MIKKIILLLAIISPFIGYYFTVYLLKFENKKIPVLKLSILSLVLLLSVLIFFRYFVLFIILRLIIFYFTNYYVFFEKIYNLLYIKAFLDIAMVSIFFGLTLFFNLKLIKRLFNYKS